MKTSNTLPVLALLGCAAMLFPSCRSTGGEGEPEIDPKEAQPGEVVIPTDAEAARNERFGDMRKKRYRGASTFDGSPSPVSEDQ